MTGLEFVLIIVLWILTVFISFMIGGAIGTSTDEELRKEMVCSNCGHKGV